MVVAKPLPLSCKSPESNDTSMTIDRRPFLVMATAPPQASQSNGTSLSSRTSMISSIAFKAGTVKADAIILATPTHTHVPLTKELLGTGLAVLIEKPVATSAAEGRDLLRACQDDHNGVYMVGHHRRHHAQVRAVKHTVDSGVLGTVMAVNGGLCPI